MESEGVAHAGGRLRMAESMNDLLERMKRIDDAWNARDWAAYSALLGEDLVARAPGSAPHGRAEHVAMGQAFCQAFADNRVENDPYLVAFTDGVWTCSVARFTGTMTGPLASPTGPMAASGERIDATLAVVARWQRGVIVEEREFFVMNDINQATARVRA